VATHQITVIKTFQDSAVYGLKHVQTLAASNHYLVPMIKELGGSFSQKWFFALLLWNHTISVITMIILLLYLMVVLLR
jgi:hypothetical protein